ncbi:unnamed protein product [Protopolystoma xenopodis]|uniref:RAD3-like helicase DEAD domain-containing protein n=1 Tax=Protopolystoma xenopodis TaxID=117903 RepID=A0A3S5C165_9PLAT|nr:unnamed protein product [Protopolystoma xenopodis]
MLVSTFIRRLYNIELENTVVIFDEAHNIEQVCEDAASVVLTSATLAAAIESLRAVGEHVFSRSSEEVDKEGAEESGTFAYNMGQGLGRGKPKGFTGLNDLTESDMNKFSRNLFFAFFL